MSIWDRFRLDGKRAMITGASRGLGRAMATALAEAGADLLLVGRDEAALKTATDDLQRTGRRIDNLTGDLAIPADAERVCQRALEDHPPIDILINNVGGRRLTTPTEQLSLADWQRILDLNLTSTFQCSRLIGSAMISRGSGSIINVSSIAGMIVNRGIHGRAYETAKAALIAFSRSLAADWAPHHIRVNVIVPGGFETEPVQRMFADRPDWNQTFLSMIPMGRLGRPEEIGPLALFLASDASSYMTGATLVIDGGYTLW